jgi:hypothetical protein
MASFAQEESRRISENIKWGKRKRFEEGKEDMVRIFGYCHTSDERYTISPKEAEIVREIFYRYVHGETRRQIAADLRERGIKTYSSGRWRHLLIDRMLNNEKYVGDAILQKTYAENHLTHKLVRNTGELPKYYVKDSHPAIVDRHLFEQAQKILKMRNVKYGNISYPYGEMLECPYCRKTLVHGSLKDISCAGNRIHNGGWGCYGKDGFRKYLVIQIFLDDAVISAYSKKHGIKMEKVDFYWLDYFIERILPGENDVSVIWKDGETTVAKMKFPKERFLPSPFSDFYNSYLERIRSGKKKNKNRFLMGLEVCENGNNESTGENRG